MGDELKPGHVVQLKSGGPHMTVVALQDEASGKALAVCVWFGNELGEPHQRTFYQSSLVKVQP